MEFSNISLRTRLRTSDEKLFGGTRKASFNKIRNTNYNSYSIWSGVTQEANVITEFNTPNIQSKYWRHWFRLDTPMVRPTEILRDMNFNRITHGGNRIICDTVPTIKLASSKNFVSTINQLIQLSKAVSFMNFSGNHIIHSFEFNNFIEQIFHSIYHPLKYHKFQADLELFINGEKVTTATEWRDGIDFTMSLKLVDDGDTLRIQNRMDILCMGVDELSEYSGVDSYRISDFLNYSGELDKDEQIMILDALGLPSNNGLEGLRDAPIEYAFCKCKSNKGGANIKEILVNDRAPVSREYVPREEISLTDGVHLIRKGYSQKEMMFPNVINKDDILLVLYTISLILRVLSSNGLTLWDFEERYNREKESMREEILNDSE